jgi:hypothetical protein
MGSQTPRNVTHPPAKQAETYEKRRRAAELRRLGWTWDAVAEEAGYSGKSAACNAVKALLHEHQSLAYDEIALYRQESIDRYLMLLEAAMPRALNGDEKMMREARLIISAIDDLIGTKAPQQVQIGESDVDRLLREALDEFRRRTAQLDRKAGADPGRPAQDG